MCRRSRTSDALSSGRCRSLFQRDRIPTVAETEALLARASPEFQLIYAAMRQCGARPGELCRMTIADIDRLRCVITLTEHKTARKTGKPRRIPIGRKLGELLDQAIGNRTAGPVFLSPMGTAWRVEGREDQRPAISGQKRPGGSESLTCCPLIAEALSPKARGIEYARRLLGHTNISTTQQYMHLDEKDLAEALDLVD